MRPVGLPDKADSPLVVDANALLGLTVGLQRLQLVARRDAQAGQLGGGVDLKLTFVGSDRMPALDPERTSAPSNSSPRSRRSDQSDTPDRGPAAERTHR